MIKGLKSRIISGKLAFLASDEIASYPSHPLIFSFQGLKSLRLKKPAHAEEASFWLVMRLYTGADTARETSEGPRNLWESDVGLQM